MHVNDVNLFKIITLLSFHSVPITAIKALLHVELSCKVQNASIFHICVNKIIIIVTKSNKKTSQHAKIMIFGCWNIFFSINFLFTFVFGNKHLNILRNVLIEVQFTNIQWLDHCTLIQQQKSRVSSDL